MSGRSLKINKMLEENKRKTENFRTKNRNRLEKWGKIMWRGREREGRERERESKVKCR